MFLIIQATGITQFQVNIMVLVQEPPTSCVKEIANDVAQLRLDIKIVEAEHILADVEVAE